METQSESVGCKGDWSGKTDSCGACCVARSNHWYSVKLEVSRDEMTDLLTSVRQRANACYRLADDCVRLNQLATAVTYRNRGDQIMRLYRKLDAADRFEWEVQS